MPKILLIHGVFMNRFVMKALSQKLTDIGYEVETFTYPFFPDKKDLEEEFLDRVRSYQPEIIIGHSLGGCIALKELKNYSHLSHTILCLGSPLRGSGIAKSLEGGSFLNPLTHAVRSVLLHPITLSSTVTRVGVIAGNDNRIGFRLLFQGVEGESDGTVAVSDTKIDGLSDHIVLPVGHTSMLFSPLVFDQIFQFIKLGTFKH